MAAPAVVLDGPVIAAGESLSNAIDVSAGAVVRILMPDEWTPANMTFQISSDGTRFGDALGLDGREVLLSVKAGACLPISLLTTYLNATTWIKLRSGSRDYPMRQQAERTFQIVLSTVATSTVPPA